MTGGQVIRGVLNEELTIADSSFGVNANINRNNVRATGTDTFQVPANEGWATQELQATENRGRQESRSKSVIGQ